MIVDTPWVPYVSNGSRHDKLAATPHTLTKSRYQPKSSGQSDKWRKRLRLFLGQGECTTRHVADLDSQESTDQQALTS